jgi:oligoendopeptidase F
MPQLSRRDMIAGSVLVAAMAATPAFAQNGKVPTTWDLTELYPSDAAWAAERQAIIDALPTIARYKGRLGESPATLREALQTISDIARRYQRLATYSSLKADEDTQIAANQERDQLSTTLGSQFGEAVAWVDPELLSVGPDKIRAFIAAEPDLGKFRFALENTLRRAPHTLGEEAETVLAAASNPIAGVSTIRGQLANSDIPWPEVKLADGKTVRLDAQGYSLARTSENRADRKMVFDRYWGTYQTYDSTFGTSLATQVNANIFRAKSRKYPSALASALAPGNIPEGVYRTLIAETNAGLPVLHRYFDVRRRLLKLPDMHYYDVYPSVTKIDRAFTIGEARDLTLAAVQPLGKEYVDLLRTGIDAPWTHVYPQKGKRSGAYMNPGAYDVHPYILLNHTDDYDGVTTFAHEWGHGMHSVLAAKAQPFEMADYSIFTAEIASTLNEQLLVRHMLKGAKSNAERLFYLDQLMENFRGTFFRQTMFAEFELAIHEAVEGDQALSGESLSAMYLDLLKKYHGPKMIIDPAYAIEWAGIPHFYYNFYVYQYATSIAASVFFDDQILNGGAKARDTYLNVLRAGGSDYPVEILRKAGLDMASPAPYRALIAKFSRTLDEVEKLMAT